jgi:hypothetical protein
MANSVISAFVDAVRRAVGRKPDIDAKELARSSGGSLGSAPPGSFDPQRPAPKPNSGAEVGDGSIQVASSDPEEGGEQR